MDQVETYVRENPHTTKGQLVRVAVIQWLEREKKKLSKA
jgi:hypothetical protein